MKICKNCEKQEINNKTDMIFSCDKYVKIRSKAFNNITELKDINFQSANDIK